MLIKLLAWWRKLTVSEKIVVLSFALKLANLFL